MAEPEVLDCGGIKVIKETILGNRLHLSIDTWDRSTAEVVASGFGLVTDNMGFDTHTGYWTFIVRPNV